MSAVDTAWFKGKIADARLSQRGLAKRLGKDPSSFNLILNGKRLLPEALASDLARELGVTLDEIAAHASIDYGAGDAEILKLVGHIDGDGRVAIDKSPSGNVQALGRMPPGSVALVMRTTQTDLDMMNGWVAFAGPISERPVEAVDRTAVVKIKGEPCPVLRLIRRGSSSAVFTLTGIGQRPVYDAEIEWFRLLLAFRPL